MSKNLSQKEATSAVCAALMRDNLELRKQNARLRKALAFYAEEDWDRCLSDGYSFEEFGETWNFGALARDKGKVARVALQETEE